MELRCRARDLGIQIGLLTPGPLNAITDVPGVRVGHASVIEGDSARTGVTAVLFDGCDGDDLPGRLFAGACVASGTGELTGLVMLSELGFLETPVMMTNTLSVGLVRDAVQQHLVSRYPVLRTWADPVIPLVGECNDGFLNDMYGMFVREPHVRHAISTARCGPVEEGAVGGGTGLYSFDLKSGIGTASRRLGPELGGYTLGCLVMSNMGDRRRLCIDGVPVGLEMADELLTSDHIEGSCVAVVATDAPLLPLQLSGLAKRAALGLGRVGSYGSHGSGEFVVAVSTAIAIRRGPGELTMGLEVLIPSRSRLNPLYQAAMETCEEAVVNSMLMARTMTGRNGHVVHALPLARLVEIMRRYGRAVALPGPGDGGAW